MPKQELYMHTPKPQEVESKSVTVYISNCSECRFALGCKQREELNDLILRGNRIEVSKICTRGRK